MKFLKTLILGFTLLLSNLAQAQFDKYNTYLWNPKSTKPWFEWWYYKVIIPETKESFYFIYGVVNPWDKEKKSPGSGAFVGMGDFTALTQVENRVGVDQFYARTDQTYVEIDGSIATDTNFRGNLLDKNGERSLWDVSIQKDWSYSAMGWIQGTKISNIMWYPAQASARCSGTITSHGKLHQFTNAPCYQDRNWGRSFPLWWTWIVSNHFKNSPGTALVAGGGRAKYFNSNISFEGLSIGLTHKGIEYHFKPQDFAKVRGDINFGKWEMKATHGINRIEISAFAPKDKFLDIQFLTPSGELFHDYETLFGEVTVKLYRRDLFSWKLVETLYSDAAGIEYGEPAGRKYDTTLCRWKNICSLEKL